MADIETGVAVDVGNSESRKELAECDNSESLTTQSAVTTPAKHQQPTTSDKTTQEILQPHETVSSASTLPLPQSPTTVTSNTSTEQKTESVNDNENYEYVNDFLIIPKIRNSTNLAPQTGQPALPSRSLRANSTSEVEAKTSNPIFGNHFGKLLTPNLFRKFRKVLIAIALIFFMTAFILIANTNREINELKQILKTKRKIYQPAPELNFLMYDGFQYWLTPEPHTWEESRTTCQKMGGDIAAEGFRNESRREIGNRFSTESQSVWIGLQSSGDKFYFEWIDGVPSYSNNTFWGNGEPKKKRCKECVEIDKKSSLFYSVDCSMLRRAFCSKQSCFN